MWHRNDIVWNDVTSMYIDVHYLELISKLKIECSLTHNVKTLMWHQRIGTQLALSRILMSKHWCDIKELAFILHFKLIFLSKHWNKCKMYCICYSKYKADTFVVKPSLFRLSHIKISKNTYNTRSHNARFV
jgi:hypothetical protein